ncbi:LacI family transcriptional regulator [Paenibacillus sp. P26]|nr:LacI family transcriptional regulator [Paenibacillus sp. P26]UUZ93416.1 LacI family transcriptional regulator [Paenibacillus sp. P25]
MERKYTLKDIAKLANVSDKTVSRVVNNEGRVKKETKEKILRILKEKNYTINTYAKGLTQRKTYQILVVSDIDRDLYPVQRTSIIINSIIKEAGKHQYKVVLVNNLDEMHSNYFGVLERGYFDGMIVLNSPRNNALLESVESLGVPIIVSGKNDKFTFVGTDYELGAYLAAKYLFDKGAKTIRSLLNDPAWPTHIEKINGFKRALQENGGKNEVEDQADIVGVFNSKDVYQYVEHEFQNGTLADGLIVSDDFSALGAIKAVNKYRIPCPQQVQMISFGNLPISTEVYPELSTVEQDFHMIGQMLVQKLLDRMNGQPVSSLKIQTRLIIRESTL